MKKIIAIFLCLLSSSIAAKNIISDYQRIFLPVYTNNGELMMAIRVFNMNNVPSFLVVNPANLDTKVIPGKEVNPRDITQKNDPGYSAYWKIAGTRYYQLLNQYTAPPYTLENQGVTHANVNAGNILTIDMCPSSKPFESDFFTKLTQLSNKSGQATPVAIAISGMWLIKHPQEFSWLTEQQKENKLAITWVNHSFSHVYYKDLPHAENFLLSPETNITAEILLTEKYLLEFGEIPSVFFRFPGLVSDEAFMKELKRYGLIPLGADAWLAKNQVITPGGIILVHGNSNEHAGIVKILPLLDQLIFLDLKTSI